YSWTKKERAIYDQAKKREDDNVSCLNQKFNEGKKEGIQIGEERGIQIGHEKGRKAEKSEVAKNSLKAGVSIDVIAEITGLSLDEIEQLKEEVTS
ncbi:MAG: Rpn family recombination-promoting nuclease/putative transposase, partial [Wolbachia sp.]